MKRLSRKLRSRTKLANLIAYDNPKSFITEQYRLIRSNIHFASVDKEIQSIVVTSAEPSEGKSTTAANLAIVLAQQGRPVLLLDADLRKPNVHYAFNVSNIHGLTSVLKKEISLSNAISNTHVPDLDILTSGPIPPNPAELLNSKAMETLMEEIRGVYEYIVYDTPPVLAVTDPQILANKCDGVVMVVASGKTQKDRAIKAKGLLEGAKAQLLGVVVNGVKYNNSSYYSEYK